MNSRELRIGNYVAVDGTRATVTAIFANGPEDINARISATETKAIKNADAQPIPINRELLIHCCKFDTQGRYTLGLDSHRYFLKVEDNFIVLLNRQGEAIIHFWDVKNLHQLQNLYYALKGEELPVSFD